ncbi:MAG: DUF5107 domain-containing protein [Bacteroidota bacterium]
MHTNKLFLPLSLFLIGWSIWLQPLFAQVQMIEEDWVIPTYPLGPPDKNPMFFNNESYQGASRHYYPYYLQDAFSKEKQDQSWKALILENEFIKVCVTPEIGGKIFYATDKTNGYNFLYKNDVVKPANIGMTGAWVSGGIEWNVLHHHRASSFMPVDYDLQENEDGSKTIWVGETELRHRMRWTIGITVFPGKSYVRADIKIHNPTPFTHSLLYWANVATHTNEHYQTIFPPSVQTVTYHAKNSFSQWPISQEVYNGRDFTKGVDISWWKNVKLPNSFFAHDLKEDFMGGYDHGKNSGTIHIGDHNIVKGAKLWEWGSGDLGQAIEAQLNENAGPYVELMVGAFSDNQPDYSWIRPYEVKHITQHWYPIKDIDGFTYANLNGAVNLKQLEDQSIFLSYHSTQEIKQAKILLKKKSEILYEKTVDISPSTAFVQAIPYSSPFKMTDLSTEMIDMETGEVLIQYQPKEHVPPESLPAVVSKPPAPKDIANIEEVFLTGSRIEQFYNPRIDPMDYYREVLRRDPGDARTNTAVGNIYLQKGDYQRARQYLSRAIQRLTKDYTRPSDGEALYLQGITLKALGLYDEAIDTLYRASWDLAQHAAAYLELARISTLQGKYSKALSQVNESLTTNSRNNSALALKASLLRKLDQYDQAATLVQMIRQTDPLDFRTANEAYLLAKAGEDKAETSSSLYWLKDKMRDYHHNYMDLATAYLNDGLLTEAEEVLLRFQGKDPIITYYLGFFAHLTGKREQAYSLFQQATRLPVDYCFPFRLETVKVLRTALTINPSDGQASYYLGNILYNKQPEKAIGYWDQAIRLDPSLAIAHRNLGWGNYRYKEDGQKAIQAYEQAINIDDSDPMYYVELDRLYEISNTPIDTRLKLFEGKNETVSKREDAFTRQIAVLTLAGQADQAVTFLEGKDFTFNESSQEVYDIIANAHLLLGIQHLNSNQASHALASFQQAMVPDELAFFSSSGARNIQTSYFMGLAYEKMRKKSKARNLYESNAIRDPGSSDYIRFYQGTSFAKLGKKAEADAIFQSLIDNANKEIKLDQSDKVDFFAKFGGQETENARLSNAYLMRGLGHKGLGQMDQARQDIEKAMDLSVSNLNAIIEGFML